MSLEKNYLVKSEEIKMKRAIKTPKLVIAVRELSTVERRTLNESHDLIILKIRSNLKALRTERPPSPPGIDISTKLIITIKQSKTLKPSATYFLIPKAKSLRNISIAKMKVKK